MYIGVCQGKRVRTSYDMVHLRHIPAQYSHLTGLLDIFKDKLVCVKEDAMRMYGGCVCVRV